MEDEQYLGLCIIGISVAIFFYSFTIFSRFSEPALIFGLQLLGASIIFIVIGVIMLMRGKKKAMAKEV